MSTHSIREYEENLRLAMIQSDLEKLNELVDDDLVFTTHQGQRITKKDDLEIHRSGLLKFDNIVLSDFQILTLSDDSVVVSTEATIEATFNGEKSNGRFRFTRVWNRRGSGYKVIAGHCSQITQ